MNGILKVKNGERNFDFFGARKTFDDYVPGAAPLRLSGAPQQAGESIEPGASDGTSAGSEDEPAVPKGRAPAEERPFSILDEIH